MTTTHPWREARLLALGLAIALVGLVTVIGSGTAKAAPAGAATNLQVYNQQCVSGGNVLVSISWNPSRLGTQWFDVSQNSNFAGFQNQGPLASNAYYIGWVLPDSTTHYGRVATFAQQGILTSDTLQFQTINCGTNFSAPQIVDVEVFDDFVRIDWQAGSNNLWYCVDTAFTQFDLLNVTGSWHNWGCGTTNTVIDLGNLACDRQHFARVWAAGPGTSGHSQIVNFVSQDCDINFTPPSIVGDQVLSSTSARLDWSAGTNNTFFCVDIAQSEDDLEDLDGTWFNRCGAAGTVIDVTGLQCETTYWWRVWAAGPGTSGYSGTDSFTTSACAVQFVPPTDLDADVIAGNDVQFVWEEQSSVSLACVDVAESEGQLTGFGATFQNFCNGGDEVIVADDANFECGEEYFWRVFARGPDGQGYSEIESFVYDHTGC